MFKQSTLSRLRWVFTYGHHTFPYITAITVTLWTNHSRSSAAVSNSDTSRCLSTIPRRYKGLLTKTSHIAMYQKKSNDYLQPHSYLHTPTHCIQLWFGATNVDTSNNPHTNQTSPVKCITQQVTDWAGMTPTYLNCIYVAYYKSKHWEDAINYNKYSSRNTHRFLKNMYKKGRA